MRDSLSLLLAVTAAAQEPPPVFHSGTRLVEVEVVVRDQRVLPPIGSRAWFAWALDTGPPFGPPGVPLKGLTKEDFTLLDQDQPQTIALFHPGPSTDSTPMVLPAGAVSNRQDSRGQPVNSATAVLIDFLNGGFLGRGMSLLGMTEFLRSLTETDSRIALYTLGEKLHVLHDFTDDPQDLTEIAAELNQPHGKLPPEFASAVKDLGDLMDMGAAEVHGQITIRALQTIVRRLSGVPGRKNLVWLGIPNRLPSAIIAMIQRANIVLYPVGGKGLGGFDDAFSTLEGEHQLQDVATATGGRQFYDARDLRFAVRTAEEDAGTAYTLGYYPDEDMLDGKFHKITVKLHGKAPDKQPLEVHFRPGYLATKAAVVPLAPSRQDLFEGPGNSARIGLVAQATPETQHPDLYDVHVTVDLHDIHLEPKEGHFTGAFDISVPNPSKHTVTTGTAQVDLTSEQLANALEKGFSLVIRGAKPESGEIRVVVLDRWTDIAGSLRVPVVKK